MNSKYFKRIYLNSKEILDMDLSIQCKFILFLSLINLILLVIYFNH